MADLPLRQELFQRFRAAALATPGTRISPREIDRPGSDANLIAAGSSFVGEEVVGRQAQQLAGVFESTATGKLLDRVIFDRKRLPRLPAAPAVGQVILTRPNATAGAGSIVGGLPGSIPPPTRITTNTGINYVLLQTTTWGALDLGPKAVNVQAELAGVAYEVDAGQQWSFADPVFDPSIQIANPITMAGGADEETDDAYKERSASFFPTLRRGIVAAILFGLRNTPGVASAQVIEVPDAEGEPAGFVQGFVLDALGNSNAQLCARASLTLLTFRGGGVRVFLIPGAVEYVSIILAPTFDTRIVLDSLAGFDAIRNVLIASLNNLLPGQELQRSQIIAAARSVPGVQLADSGLIAPAGDLLPAAPFNAFRTRAELITPG